MPDSTKNQMRLKVRSNYQFAVTACAKKSAVFLLAAPTMGTHFETHVSRAALTIAKYQRLAIRLRIACL